MILSENRNFTCSLCEGRSALTQLKSSQFSIYTCRSCALGVTEPPTYVDTAHYDDFPEWSEVVLKKERLFRGYQRNFLSHISAHAKMGGTLLDVGCSLGLLVDEAKILGYSPEGIDLDEKAVEHARRKGRSVSLSDLEAWNKGNYDIICLSHTLEHMANPIQTLRECNKRLSPTGILAIAVPCHRGLLPKIFPHWWYGWMPTQHYYHYSVTAMGALMTKAGFQSLEIAQNSMDHRLQREYMCRWQDFAKGVMLYVTAVVGGALGMGDQIIAIGSPVPNR